MLELKLLGKPEVLRDGVPVTASVAAKPKALLAYLAVVARPVSRDVLANLLWGESDQTDAAASLRQTLATLRKLGLDAWIEVTRDAVKFNFDAPHVIDFREFEVKSREPRAKNQDEQSWFLALGSCVSLYRGDFLEGFNLRDAPEFDEWVVTQREHYRELALRLLQTLAEAALNEGRYTEGVDYARRTLALDAWREEAHCLLMLCYARSGQRSAALAQYAECRRVLDKELGVPPSAETTALYERIYAATQSVSQPLPPQPTPFVGRTHELDKIKALLHKPECRLLTLLGMGGSGKTRLALASAAHLQSAFLNGVCLVPLADVTEPDQLSNAIAAAIKLTLTRGDATTQLANYFAAKEMVLLLDSFESLVANDAAVALLDALLARAPMLKLLVTSRERLNLASEWVLDVPPMSEADALAMFQQSARRVSANEFAEADAPLIQRICKLAGYLPLGMALAAAWVRAMTLDDIASELTHSTALLATSQRHTPERHRSMQAVFEHSWRLLSRGEQRALAALSVFRGGFTRDAARMVADANPVVLAGLVDKSLVERDASGRFALHDLVRQYAADPLRAAGEERARQDRHCHYFAEFAASCKARLGSPDQKAAADEAACEIDNLRVMWQHAVIGQDALVFEQAYALMFWAWDTRGWYAEIDDLFNRAIIALSAEAYALTQALTRARLMIRRAVVLNRMSHIDEADGLLRESAAIAEAHGDRAAQGFAVRHLCYRPMTRGEHALALEYAERSVSLYRQTDDLEGRANALISNGIVLTHVGRYADARALYLEASDIFEEMGDDLSRAVALVDLGNVAYWERNLEQARDYFRASLDIQERFGERRGIAIGLNNLACVLIDLEDWPAARAMSRQCVAAFADMGMREGVMHSQNNLALAALGEGDLAEAALRLRSALELALDLPAASDATSFVITGARLLQAQGKPQMAATVLAALRHQPACIAYTLTQADALLAELPAEQVTAAHEQAHEQPLEEFVGQLLQAVVDKPLGAKNLTGRPIEP